VLGPGGPLVDALDRRHVAVEAAVPSTESVPPSSGAANRSAGHVASRDPVAAQQDQGEVDVVLADAGPGLQQVVHRRADEGGARLVLERRPGASNSSSKKPGAGEYSELKLPKLYLEGLQEPRKGRRTTEVMSHGPASPGRLTQGEQRALAAFLAGRLPAGQLHEELGRARDAALAALAAREAPAEAPSPVAAPALRAA
jgi:hypothetical protein